MMLTSKMINEPNESNVQVVNFSYPTIFDIDTAIRFLNDALNELQGQGFTILSVTPYGENKFMVEIRKVI